MGNKLNMKVNGDRLYSNCITFSAFGIVNAADDVLWWEQSGGITIPDVMLKYAHWQKRATKKFLWQVADQCAVVNPNQPRLDRQPCKAAFVCFLG